MSENFTGVVEFPAGTRTAADAAAAIRCEVGQIVKSLVFRAGEGGGGRYWLVVSHMRTPRANIRLAGPAETEETA